MKSFIKWVENYGGSVGNPSGVDSEGRGEELMAGLPKPGAFPTYSTEDLPPTAKKKSKKKCNCK